MGITRVIGKPWSHAFRLWSICQNFNIISLCKLCGLISLLFLYKKILTPIYHSESLSRLEVVTLLRDFYVPASSGSSFWFLSGNSKYGRVAVFFSRIFHIRIIMLRDVRGQVLDFCRCIVNLSLIFNFRNLGLRFDLNANFSGWPAGNQKSRSVNTLTLDSEFWALQSW